MSSTDSPRLIGGRYQFGQRLGIGGMGVVYRATDLQTGQAVAIKMLKPAAGQLDPSMIERFCREADALRQLDHPNIVKVLETVEEGDQHYIVMEFISGGSLALLLGPQARLPLNRILQISLQVADALTRAHYLKIVHRDIKPGNVLLDEDGNVYLSDFGVAYLSSKKRMTQPGSVVGTPNYMSPEALTSDRVDARADIWSFGVLLFEMLTGKLPFDADSIAQILVSVMSNPVPDLETLRPDAPTALVDLVFRMLEKAPEARIPSVRLVGAELEAILSQLEDDSSSIGVARRVVHTERFATPILSTTVVKRNFPAQTTPFVGREREVVEIDNLLRNTDLRLITLLGPGGAGKTRLSIQAAERQADNFQDGLYFVPLSPLDTAENIIPTIADAVDYQFQPDARGLEVQLLDFLRDKRLLLLLDNFEHLIDGVNVVVDILSTAPNVKILVTSRERLRLRDEQIFEVHGLYLPPEGITPEELQEYSAAKLFLQSARRVRPGFEINSKTASHIVRICHLVDGMPLGIELAASWLEALSVEEVAGEIEQSLDFLETDLRDVPQRHRSIRTVFDYSWDLLTEDERDTFMKLSIFRGGFEREAAQYVTGASLRTLSHLVSKSLLKRDPSGRYDLHKMLRQYTERHFDQHPDKEQTNRSFVTYFSEFAYKLEPVFNSKSEKHALDQVELEIENIRTAWRWASEHQDWQALDKLMHTMMLFYLGISMLREGLEVFNKLVEALDYLEEERTFWRACVRQTWLAGRLGEFSQVWEISNDAYHYFKQHGEKTEAAYALNNMSYACMMQGRYQESIQHAAEAGELSANASDSTAWFMAMGNRGYAEFLAGNYEEARNLYEVMLQYAEIKDYSLSGRAYGLNNLGEILRELGDLEKARQLFQQAHGVFKSYRHRQGMAFTMNNLAEVHAIQGNYMEAGRIYAQAYRLNKDIGDRAGIGHSLSALGSVAFYSRDYEGAAAYFRQALELASEFNLIDVVPHALVGIASVLATTGERERALVIITSVQRSLRTSMPVSIDQKTTHLADQLTSELPEDVSRAAVERGTQLEIGTVIADLVS